MLRILPWIPLVVCGPIGFDVRMTEESPEIKAPKRHRVVLVGCGGMSRAWLGLLLEEFRDEAELVALVDLDESAARKRAEASGCEAVWIGTDLAKAIEETGADVVFDVTVPAAHYPVTKTALEAGCHVLGEKPLAETVEQARELAALAEERGLIFAVLQNRRYNGNIDKVRRILASGRLGKVNTVNADFYLSPHFEGFRAEMEHVLLLDMAIHTFDQARHLSGTDPLSVYCHEYNPSGSWARHGAAAMAIFEMTEELVFNYRGSWVAEGHRTDWFGEWRIVGEKGTIRWDGATEIVLEQVDECEAFTGRGVRRFEATRFGTRKYREREEGHGGVMADFFRSIGSGQTPLTVASDNLKSLAMVEAAIRSAETGQRVAIA